MEYIKDKVCSSCQRAIPLRDTPWLTKQSREFLDQFFQNNPDAKVLEFGAGGSTIWFSGKTKNLITIESQQDWFSFVKAKLERLGRNVDLRLIPNNYFEVCATFEKESFDLILVDARYRVQCIETSKNLVKPGGILMLDNADRVKYDNLKELLADWEFTETVQEEPDEYGYFYENWQTNWWKKRLD